METEETHFLRAIRAEPNEDFPRLVYSDWLEENGQAERAEFIRIQCAIAAAADDDPKRPALSQRENRLWRKFGPNWRAQLPHDLRIYPFHRGFVTPRELEMTPAQLLSLSDSYLDAAPQWSLRMRLRDGDPLTSLARSKRLERITRLSLHVDGAAFGPLGDLLGASRWKHLRSLLIDGRPFDRHHVRIVANSPALAGLRHLSLSCNPLCVEGAEALAESPYLTKLEVLNLPGCGIGEAGLRALASAPGLRHLRELNLPQNRLDNGSASAIIASRHFKRLRSLGLFGNHLGDAGARALAHGRNLESLSKLDLGLNRIGPTGGRALADSPFLTHLNSLYLGGNRVGEDPIALCALKTRFGEKVTV